MFAGGYEFMIAFLDTDQGPRVCGLGRGYKVGIDQNHVENFTPIESLINVEPKMIVCSENRTLILDTQNNILFDYGSLPDLSFPRVNQDANHYYIQRPAKTWSVTRVN